MVAKKLVYVYQKLGLSLTTIVLNERSRFTTNRFFAGVGRLSDEQIFRLNQTALLFDRLADATAEDTARGFLLNHIESLRAGDFKVISTAVEQFIAQVNH